MDGDNVEFVFEDTASGDIRYRIEFANIKLHGYLGLAEADLLRSELTKAINKARKQA